MTVNERARVLAFLDDIEWKGSRVHFECPSCQASREHGHEAWCEWVALRTALAADEGRTEGERGADRA